MTQREIHCLHTFHCTIHPTQRGVYLLIKQRPKYKYQIWKLSTPCDIMADQYRTPLSNRWHTHDRAAPENTDNTLNKRWLVPTITVCYECVIKVHLLLWFTVWAGNAEMITHTGIRMSPCGLSQSQRHTHDTSSTDTLRAKHVCLISSSGLKILNHLYIHFHFLVILNFCDLIRVFYLTKYMGLWFLRQYKHHERTTIYSLTVTYKFCVWLLSL